MATDGEETFASKKYIFGLKTPDEVKPPISADKVVREAGERLKSRTFREVDSEM